ncbi:ABC transporter substrate-binding protein [Variovorax sp. J22P168]|uniref:TRAP transporter substrate-binding protein n=1 Tax=Variovorax jilinensis TaxID=3053513 RepID=UPI0025780BAF|nr:ABC transporter substrate-binding protein [Variovorax sp. J22P168]MDM0012775.1 ABC transporter substrate-binding protein [Variovorax sp. J22P168]
MQRRSLIRRGGMAGVLAAGLAPAVQAQALTRWRLASSFSKPQELLFGAATAFARQVGELSGGRFQIEVHGAGELMSAQGVFDGVQRGAVEACHTTGAFAPDANAAFALGAAIPFGMNARQLSAWMSAGNGQKLVREFHADFGAVSFACGIAGAQRLGWFVREIRSLQDFKGLRLRVDGLAGRAMARFGALPQGPASGVDVRDALARGAIGAAEGLSPWDDQRSGMPKVARICHYPGWWSGATQLDLLVNQKAFDALSVENKAIVQIASAAVQVQLLASYDARNPAALRQLTAAGAQFKPFPKPVLDALFKESMALSLDLDRSNPAWKKLHQDYRAFQQASLRTDRVTEAAFDSFLQSARL